MSNLTIRTLTGVRQIFMLLVCWFLFSCAPAVTLPLTPTEAPTPLSDSWQKLSGGNQFKGALSAMADIDLVESGTRRQHLRVALLLRRPAMMRIEGVPVFGPPNFSLSLNKEKLKIFLPGKNEFYWGRPSQENLAHFLPFSLSPANMVDILLGVPPLPSVATGEKISYRESWDNDKRRLDLFLNNRIIQTLWSDSKGERLTDMELTDAGTELKHQVTYGNYYRMGENELPQQVTIASKYSDARIIIHYDEMELRTSEDKETFDLAIPADVKPTSLDRDDTPWE